MTTQIVAFCMPSPFDRRLTNFLTHRLIGRVAAVDVRLIAGILNATSNLVTHEKEIKICIVINARLYFFTITSWNLLYSEQIMSDKLIERF